MFRTALEEYCINYITPLGALLTLKCLVRLAKDLNKENSSTKASSYFTAVTDKKKMHLASFFAHDTRIEYSS